MVAARVRELRLGLVGLLALAVGAQVRVRHREHGRDRQDLVGALELGRDDEHLGELRLEREGRHEVAERRQVCGAREEEGVSLL